MDKISALFYKTVEETTKKGAWILISPAIGLREDMMLLKGTILIIFRKNIVMMSI